MCILKLLSEVEYFGLPYFVSGISKKQITLMKGKTIVEIRPSLVLKELANNNLKVLKV